MREIKFRAWDNVVNKMLEPLSGVVWGRAVVPADYVEGLYGAIPEHIGGFLGDEMIIFDEVDLMEWTGLQDKNGKDIYQDDILRVVEDPNKKYGNNPSYFKYGECGVVSWDTRYTGWVMWHSDCEERESLGNLVRLPDWNFVEIIGNIYTDSHLLKEEHDTGR